MGLNVTDPCNNMDKRMDVETGTAVSNVKDRVTVLDETASKYNIYDGESDPRATWGIHQVPEDYRRYNY